MNKKSIFATLFLIIAVSGINIYANNIKLTLDILKFMGITFLLPLAITMLTNGFCIYSLDEIKETKLLAHSLLFTSILLVVSGLFLKGNMTPDVVEVMFNNSLYLEGASIEFSQGGAGTSIFTAIVFTVLIYASGKIASIVKKKKSLNFVHHINS